MVTSHLECTQLDMQHEYFLQHEKAVLYFSTYLHLAIMFIVQIKLKSNELVCIKSFANRGWIC